MSERLADWIVEQDDEKKRLARVFLLAIAITALIVAATFLLVWAVPAWTPLRWILLGVGADVFVSFVRWAVR